MSSSDQIRDLSNNLEQLRRQQAEILAQEQQANNRFEQLFAIVGLSQRQASDAFVLQSDRGTSRKSLFPELIQAQIDRQGLRTGAKKLDQQIAVISSRLRTLAQQEPELNSLQPDVQVDLAVFASTLTQSWQWLAKKTRMATLVVLLGLGGGFWVTPEAIASQIAQAQTARIDLSLQSQPNETYETLLSRAEAAVLAAVKENFDQDTQVTDVSVMVMAENYAANAPVLSLKVSRTQWSSNPDVQRWSTYFTTARSLLGFKEVANTTPRRPGTGTPVIAEQPTNSFLGRLGTGNPATTPNQTPAPSTDPDPLPASAAVPVAPQGAQPQTARVEVSINRQPNETYETLLSRAEAAAQAAVRENFDQGTQVTGVSVMVEAQNHGAIAPVLSLEVARRQWRSLPDIQRWVTYFTNARSLLGFDSQPETATSATPEQPDTATPDEAGTDNLDTAPSQTPASGTDADRLPPDAAVPVDPEENSQSPQSPPNSFSTGLPSTSTPANAPQAPLAAPANSGTTINTPNQDVTPPNGTSLETEQQ